MYSASSMRKLSNNLQKSCPFPPPTNQLLSEQASVSNAHKAPVPSVKMPLVPLLKRHLLHLLVPSLQYQLPWLTQSLPNRCTPLPLVLRSQMPSHMFEPASTKLKESKEAMPAAFSGGKHEGDSWRLAAHHTTSSSSSSSSTGMSSAGEGSTATSGGADQQETADVAEVFPLQPSDPQDTVAVNKSSLKPPKEGQRAMNCPLLPLEISKETAAGSACAEQQEAAEAADSSPLQPSQQQDTTAVQEPPLKPTNEAQTAAPNDHSTRTEPQLAAGYHPEQPTKPEGEAAASKHSKQLYTGAEQAGAGTLPQQLTHEVAAAGDESTLQATQSCPPLHIPLHQHIRSSSADHISAS